MTTLVPAFESRKNTFRTPDQPEMRFGYDRLHLDQVTLHYRWQASQPVHVDASLHGRARNGRDRGNYLDLDWARRSEWPDWLRAAVVTNLPDGWELVNLDAYCGGANCEDCAEDDGCCAVICGCCSRANDCSLGSGWAYDTKHWCYQHNLSGDRG